MIRFATITNLGERTQRRFVRFSMPHTDEQMTHSFRDKRGDSFIRFRRLGEQVDEWVGLVSLPPMASRHVSTADFTQHEPLSPDVGQVVAPPIRLEIAPTSWPHIEPSSMLLSDATIVEDESSVMVRRSVYTATVNITPGFALKFFVERFTYPDGTFDLSIETERDGYSGMEQEEPTNIDIRAFETTGAVSLALPCRSLFRESGQRRTIDTVLRLGAWGANWSARGTATFGSNLLPFVGVGIFEGASWGPMALGADSATMFHWSRPVTWLREFLDRGVPDSMTMDVPFDEPLRPHTWGAAPQQQLLSVSGDAGFAMRLRSYADDRSILQRVTPVDNFAVAPLCCAYLLTGELRYKRDARKFGFRIEPSTVSITKVGYALISLSWLALAGITESMHNPANVALMLAQTLVADLGTNTVTMPAADVAVLIAGCTALCNVVDMMAPTNQEMQFAKPNADAVRPLVEALSRKLIEEGWSGGAGFKMNWIESGELSVLGCACSIVLESPNASPDLLTSAAKIADLIATSYNLNPHDRAWMTFQPIIDRTPETWAARAQQEAREEIAKQFSLAVGDAQKASEKL